MESKNVLLQTLVALGRSIKDIVIPPTDKEAKDRLNDALYKSQHILVRQALKGDRQIDPYHDKARTFHGSARDGETDMLRVLVKNADFDINLLYKKNPHMDMAETALLAAVKEGQTHAVKTLLDLGANPYMGYKLGAVWKMTPRESAELLGHKKIIALLRTAEDRRPDLDPRTHAQAPMPAPAPAAPMPAASGAFNPSTQGIPQQEIKTFSVRKGPAVPENKG